MSASEARPLQGGSRFSGAVLLVTALGSASAHAHKPSDSYLSLQPTPAGVAVQWDLALKDLHRELVLDGDGDGNITADELRESSARVAALARSGLALRRGGAPCSLELLPALEVTRHSDGVYAVNGKVVVLQPQLGNKPIAPTYRFVPNEFQDRPELMQTAVHAYLPPGELESFLIGTDGVDYLIKAEGTKMPGREERVHPLRDFWETDEFLGGDDALQLYFRQLNTESCRLVHPTREDEARGKRSSLLRESRLLLDDTTLVFGRQQKGG